MMSRVGGWQWQIVDMKWRYLGTDVYIVCIVACIACVLHIDCTHCENTRLPIGVRTCPMGCASLLCVWFGCYFGSFSILGNHPLAPSL